MVPDIDRPPVPDRRFVSALLRGLDRFVDLGAWMAVACCVLLIVVMLAEIALVNLFGYSQPYAVEYCAYMSAIILFGGSGHALRHASHIRVGALVNFVPRRIAFALDLGSTIAALAVAALLAGGLIDLAWRSFALGSLASYTMRTPLWIPQSALAFSALLLALALLARALRLVFGVPLDEVPNALADGAL